MCTKMNKITMRDVGVIGKQQCTKPKYKDGLCKYHYDRQQAKLVKWGDRLNYISATQEDLTKQRSLKLKNSNTHQLFKYIKNCIYKYNSKTDKYEPTNIKPDFNLFCVKILT